MDDAKFRRLTAHIQVIDNLIPFPIKLFATKRRNLDGPHPNTEEDRHRYKIVAFEFRYVREFSLQREESAFLLPLVRPPVLLPLEKPSKYHQPKYAKKYALQSWRVLYFERYTPLHTLRVPSSSIIVDVSTRLNC
ncbi:uncharacterized protein LOC124348766 [Daphnia pulicaria]|uniref:uncharacterized protein LOC124348766 n=1 Tax=Daphnia pulicaria TaxID=35523 RepID=UPI001EEB47C4|nr:uncharacterized protein LOC124348766 [Daphnia pulicaria]